MQYQQKIFIKFIITYIMFSYLTKFIIKTRMTQSMKYKIYIFMFLFSIIVNFFYFEYNFPRLLIFKYIVVILISTIIIFPLMSSGNIIIKSDKDFLLNIPLNKKCLFKSFFMLSVINYIPVFIFFLYIIGLALNSYYIIIGFFDSFLLYLISILIYYISTYIFKRNKYILPVLFIIYLISPLIYNYKLSIGSVFLGNVVYGTFATIIIFLILLYYIFNKYNELNFIANGKSFEKTYKSRNLTGNHVIYKLNILYSNTAFAFGVSKKRYHFSRSMYPLLIIYTIISILYFLMNYLIPGQ